MLKYRESYSEFYQEKEDFNFKITGVDAPDKIYRLSGTLYDVEESLLQVQKDCMFRDLQRDRIPNFLQERGIDVTAVPVDKKIQKEKPMLIHYEWKLSTDELRRGGYELGRLGKRVEGIIYLLRSYSSVYQDVREYLEQIQLQYRVYLSDFKTMSIDPRVLKQVDNFYYDLQGKKNERPVEDYVLHRRDLDWEALRYQANKITYFLGTVYQYHATEMSYRKPIVPDWQFADHIKDAFLLRQALIGIKEPDSIIEGVIRDIDCFMKNYESFMQSGKEGYYERTDTQVRRSINDLYVLPNPRKRLVKKFQIDKSEQER